MTGLGGGEGRRDRRVVPHLTDKDHVGALAQGSAQPPLERADLDPDLALMDERPLRGVDVLDRILEGDHVAVAGAVEMLDQGAERRRLSGPIRS